MSAPRFKIRTLVQITAVAAIPLAVAAGVVRDDDRLLLPFFLVMLVSPFWAPAWLWFVRPESARRIFYAGCAGAVSAFVLMKVRDGPGVFFTAAYMVFAGTMILAASLGFGFALSWIRHRL